jgi:hypothetical protein
MKSLAILSLAATLLMGACVQASAEQLQTMDDVAAAIQACWTPPPGIPNSWVTLSFSFKRDGSLMGPPKPTATDVKGGDAAKQAFVDAAVQGLQDCVPLDFSPALATGIGGVVYTMRFSSPDVAGEPI